MYLRYISRAERKRGTRVFVFFSLCTQFPDSLPQNYNWFQMVSDGEKAYWNCYSEKERGKKSKTKKNKNKM